VLWAEAWLPRYSLDDYARVEERLADILLNGLAAPGLVWNPQRLWTRPQAAPDQTGREMFLAVAIRLINERGYRGASVTDIAAELNLTKGSFYHHHHAKDDLVVACFEHSFGFMRNVQRRARDLEVDQWTRLATSAAALVERQVSPGGSLLRATALSALPFEIRREMVRRSERVSDHFAAMISDGVAEGSIRPVDPAIGAHVLTATINAASDLDMLLSSPVRPEDVAALYAKPSLTGLLNR
jgi:AcrR family transcriptional regulator